MHHKAIMPYKASTAGVIYTDNLCTYRHLCCVTGTLKEVVRDEVMPWNPDSESITVTTDTVAGSSEKVRVRFFNKVGSYTGAVRIYFDTQIQFNIGWCTGWTPFPVTLPTETHKTWTFTYNYTEKRLVYYCNGVQVADVVLSSTCSLSSWRNYWEREPTQVKFFSMDTASDSYCISSYTGKYNMGFWEV